MEEQGEESIMVTTIVVFSSIAIIALVFLFYYFATKPVLPFQVVSTGETSESIVQEIAKQEYSKEKSQPAEEPGTAVIIFAAPEFLPSDLREGQCEANSLAQPYRQEAWRCTVEEKIYDPCFTIPLSDMVYCKMNPLADGGDFLVLSGSLPTPSSLPEVKENWAWFLELEDGTYCAPYTDSRPIIGGKPAFYGCKSNFGSEQVFLMGDLNKSNFWTVEKIVLTQNGQTFDAKLPEEVKIKKVWQ